MSKASDVRWGRQGGRFLPAPQRPSVVAKLDEWRRARDALAKVTAAAGEEAEQLDLFGDQR